VPNISTSNTQSEIQEEVIQAEVVRAEPMQEEARSLEIVHAEVVETEEEQTYTSTEVQEAEVVLNADGSPLTVLEWTLSRSRDT
jgi:hypothetical protein